MLAKKLNGRLVKSIIEPYLALKESGTDGTILSLVASWHRKVEKKREFVDMAQFDFLLANDGKAIQVEVSYENGKFNTKILDLSKEIGGVEEEEEIARSLKLKSDAEIIEVLEKDRRVEEALRKAKHLRLFSLSFLLFDEKFNLPIWKAVLKNWPLTNYYKREKPITIEAVLSGIDGRVLEIKKII